MNNKQRKPSFAWCFFSILAIFTLGLITHQTQIPTGIEGAPMPDYVLTMDASNAPTSSSEYVSVEHTIRYTQFQYYDVKASPGNHLEIAAWGGIYNLSQITSITSVTATFSTLGSLTLYASYDEWNDFDYTLDSGVTLNFTSLPYIVEFWADDEPVTIESIVITYTCTPHEESLDKYRVYWQVDEGTILEIDYDVEPGTFPSYDGPTPTKEASGSTIYTFSGWYPELSEVYENQYYSATFTELEMTFSLINDGTEYELTAANNRSITSLEIPSYYNGLPVTSIADYVFSPDYITHESFMFESIVLPELLTSIGNSAFRGCASLTSIFIPEHVNSIGDAAFFGCSSLAAFDVDSANLNYSSIDGVLYDSLATTLILYPAAKGNSFIVPGGVNTIGDAAFAACTNLLSVTIPTSATAIGAQAFFMCQSLQNIVIPDFVTTIGAQAFLGCQSLQSIVIPDSVTTIGSGAFVNCSSLLSVTLSQGLTLLPSSLFYDCTSLGSITIPSNVTSIDTDAFYGCSGLTTITLNEGLTSIGSRVFNNCSLLNNVSLPSSLTTIGASAFSGCSALTTITLASGLTTLGEYAFYNCLLLSAINVDAANTSFSSSDGVLFNKDFSTLIVYPTGKTDATYTLPSSVTTIGASAFRYNAHITTLNIPSSLTSVGECALSNCISLHTIIVDSSNMSLRSIDNVLFDKDVTTLLVYPSGKTTTNYSVPASVTSIISFAIGYNPNITSIYIPDTVTTISSHGIYACENLTIHCQASAKPAGWHENWNYSAVPVVWGYIF